MTAVYAFYTYHNSAAQVVYPLNFLEASFVDEQEGDEIFLRKKLSGKLIFRNSAKDGITDYDYFRAIQTGANSCLDILFRVQKSCDNGATFTQIFEGVFTVNEGEWDLDNCTYSIEVRTNDVYECLIKNKNKELALMSVDTLGGYGAIANLMPDYEFYYCNTCADPACPDPPLPNVWTSFFHDTLNNNNWVACGDDGSVCQLWVYYREVAFVACSGGIAIAPSGSGWVQDTIGYGNCTNGLSKWVRLPVIGANPITVSYGSGGSGATKPTAACSSGWIQITEPHWDCLGDIVIKGLWWCASQFDTNLTGTRQVEEVFKKLITQSSCSLSVVSDFFEWSPIGDAPGYAAGNNYVTGTTNQLLDFLILPKEGSIQLPVTKGLITWDILTTILRDTFQVYWFIENSDVRFEHISYFVYQSNFDVSTTAYALYTKGTKKYKYEKTKMPKFERFKFQDASDVDFIGAEIRYDSSCVNQDEKTNIKTYDVSKVTTDLRYLINNAAVISKEGFVLIAAGPLVAPYYPILSEVCKISSVIKVNGHLSWANLHYNYWRHDRVLSSGNMNLITQNFITTKRTISGKEFKIPFCCGDTFDYIRQYFLTPLGLALNKIGVVEKAEFKIKEDTLTLTLKY